MNIDPILEQIVGFATNLGLVAAVKRVHSNFLVQWFLFG